MAVNYSVEYPLALRKITELEAENQQLRDALEDICKHMKIVGGGMHRYSGVFNIAKQALEVSDE